MSETWVNPEGVVVSGCPGVRAVIGTITDHEDGTRVVTATSPDGTIAFYNTATKTFTFHLTDES